MQIGKTGEFPGGELGDHDEGEIIFRVGVRHKHVILDFGTKVIWLGMKPQQAADLASLLMRHARKCARETGDVLTLTLG